MSERGDIVILATKGTYTGKPRPWLVVQNDAFNALDSITVCLLTTALVDGAPMLRIDVAASATNGLKEASQVQVDKTVTVPASKITHRIGTLESHLMKQVSQALEFFLDL